MSASCVEQECGSSSNHPEPSTLIVKLFHWHQSAREYKSSIICEKARVYSMSISKHVKMQCNQQPTHQTHRSKWITISRTSQNIPKVYNKCIVPIYKIPQPKELYSSAKIQNKISKDFTHLNISNHVCFMRRARMWILQ